MDAFFHILDNYKLDKSLISYAFKEAYIDSDNLFKHKLRIKELLANSKIDLRQLMSRNEREILNTLPNRVKIYRGMTISEKESDDFGISWTLDQERAAFFVFKYQRNYSTDQLKKTVHQLEVRKEDILALFNDREEIEIIYLHN